MEKNQKFTPKVLFCDIGNVLLFFDLFRSLDRFLQLGTQPAYKVLPIVFESSWMRDFDLGIVTPQQFHKEACKVFGMKLPFADFCAVWNDIFEENHALIRWLKELSIRHRVYLISNTNPIHNAWIRGRYDFFRYVHGTIISDEIGIRKPDPRIYAMALQKAGVPSSNVFFLDDLWTNVYGAQRMGMWAERYTTPSATQQAWNAFLRC